MRFIPLALPYIREPKWREKLGTMLKESQNERDALKR